MGKCRRRAFKHPVNRDTAAPSQEQDLNPGQPARGHDSGLPVTGLAQESQPLTLGGTLESF